MTAAPSSGKAGDVRAMFSRIARRYDLMNALMTFGRDGAWRRRTASAALASLPRLGLRQPLALDIGAGTADLALELVRAGAAQVLAADFSDRMLLEAQKKLSAQRRGSATPLPILRSARIPAPVPPRGRDPGLGRIDLVAADALWLPFPEATFDCITNGFLLRNVADLPAALREFHRVLRPGSRLACLELTSAPALVTPLFQPYFDRIVPLVGRLVAGDAAAYSYLPASVRRFPNARRLAEMLREAGFVEVSYRRLSIGVVALHVGVKPVTGDHRQ